MNQLLSEQLSFVRITEILDNPSLVAGQFDKKHLLNLHAFIFQDSSEHKPGITRKNTKEVWFKERVLENIIDFNGAIQVLPTHPVPYLNKNIDKVLEKTLNISIKELSTLTLKEFAQNLTTLYSKLDYIHPFHEGNSRTLRTFTYLLAKECAYTLNWNTTNVDSLTRNQLYNARDVAIYVHSYNNELSPEYTRKHKFNNHEEYLIAVRCYNFQQQYFSSNEPQLFDILLNSLTKNLINTSIITNMKGNKLK